MSYQRTREDEQTFQEVIDLLSLKQLNSKQLAEELGASRRTTLRIIKKLRESGYKIQATHYKSYWRYELKSNLDSSE